MKLPVTPLFNLHKQFTEYPQSQFGCERLYDVHTGIDIYTNPGAEVICVKSGVIHSMGLFTGPNAGSDWWNETQYVVVKSKGIYILYGEIIISSHLKVGAQVNIGESIGNVTRVLKVDKGKNPVDMLHLECYSQYECPVVWKLGRDIPRGLLNPIDILRSIND